MCVDRKFDKNLDRLGVDSPLTSASASANHAHVEVEANISDVSRLLPTQQIPGTTDLEVFHCHGNSRTQVGVLGDRCETFVRSFAQRLLGGVEEVGVSTIATRPTRPRS